MAEALVVIGGQNGDGVAGALCSGCEDGRTGD